MILIVCTSHLYIPATLATIIDNKGNVCIYTDRGSIKTFLQEMYPQMDIFLLQMEQNKGLLYKIFKSVQEKKSRILNFIKGKNITRVIFFHEGFCEEANWLIKYLWKTQKSEIIYMPVERTFDFNNHWTEIYSIKNLIKILFCYCSWGYRIHFYKYMNSTYPIMDKSFFTSVQSKEIQYSPQKVDIVKDINDKLLYPSVFPYNGIVWLENTTRLFNVKWDKESYITFLDRVYSKLPIDRVFFKGHPDKALKYGKESDLKEIPSFIPGNLIINRFSCFVGAISDLLFEAANMGIKTISTLYLYEIDKEDREMLVKYVRKRSDKIYFPKSAQEFIEELNKATNI